MPEWVSDPLWQNLIGILFFAVVFLIAVCQSRARREDNNKE